LKDRYDSFRKGKDTKDSNEKKLPIELIWKIPNISIEDLEKIYKFFRETGEESLFTEKQLLTETGIVKEIVIKNIIDYLLKNKMIEEKYWICPECGEKNEINDINCLNCGYKRENFEDIEYKMVSSITKSYSEEDYENKRKIELEKALFRALLKKIEFLKGKEEKAYLAFIDIANSTLNKNNPVTYKLKKWLKKSSKRLSYLYLFKYEKGKYLKEEGDGIYIFSLDKRPLLLLIETLFTEFDKFKEQYKIHFPENCYLKCYISDSEIIDVNHVDELSLEVEMEAFIFIKRIEKKVKEELEKQGKVTKSCLGYVVFREEESDSAELLLTNVRNYGDIKVYYKMFYKR